MSILEDNNAVNLPPSKARWFDPFLIAVIVMGLYVLCHSLPITATEFALILSGAVTVAIYGLELLNAPWRKMPRPAVTLGLVLKRSAVKWLGVMAGGALVLFMWKLLPEYAQKNYRPLFDAMPWVLPVIPFLAAAVILYTEWRMEFYEDYNWHFGLLALGRVRAVSWSSIGDGLLAWLVKGFFLPLNFCVLANSIESVRGHEMSMLAGGWPQTQSMIMSLIWITLIAAIMPGYIFSARLFGTQIKKVEHSWFGWTVTLACYPPFFSAVLHWLEYHPYIANPKWMKPWMDWTQGMPTLAYAVGIIVILTELVHYWGEAIFSVRASNLSNRGIITNGPYRFCKHPVYLIKCIGWFFIWLPFLQGGTLWKDIQLTLLFFGICGNYFMRAWVEERLLSDDPDYVAYARWMDRHGWLRKLGRLSPWFLYETRLKRWRSVGSVVL